MIREDLVKFVQNHMGIFKKDAEGAVYAVLEGIKEGVTKDGIVKIIGFGTFEVREIKAHEGVNPKTKEKIQIPLTRRLTFRAGKAIKDELNAAVQQPKAATPKPPVLKKKK